MSQDLSADLPEGWAEDTFTSIFDIQGGTQPPKKEFIYEPADNYVRLLQIRDFGAKPVPTYIPDTTKLKKCRKEEILIGRYGASVGRICTGMEGAYNVALAKLIASDELNKRFLFRFLNSELFQSPLRLISRSAQNGFNKDDLAQFNVWLPPLNEQRRIADKLDVVLWEVARCKARLDKTQTLLKRFRQSTLNAATTGKLTEGWRGENSNTFSSTNLPDNHDSLAEIDRENLFEKSKHFTIPCEWKWARLGALASRMGGGTPSKGNPSFWCMRCP